MNLDFDLDIVEAAYRSLGESNCSKKDSVLLMQAISQRLKTAHEKLVDGEKIPLERLCSINELLKSTEEDSRLFDDTELSRAYVMINLVLRDYMVRTLKEIQD